MFRHNSYSFSNRKMSIFLAIMRAILFAILLATQFANMFFILFGILAFILFSILFAITVRMLLQNTCEVMCQQTTSGPMISSFSSHFEFSRRVRKKATPFEGVCKDIFIVVEHRPPLLRASIANLERDLATLLIGNYCRRTHTTTEMLEVLSFQPHIRTLLISLYINCYISQKP